MVERAIDTRHAAWPGRPEAARPGVGQARFVLLAVAAWVAVCDLIVKLIKPTETGFYHRRTYTELILILAISAVVVYIVPLARSLMTNVGAGLMVGGAFGNALSIAVFPLGVPNPITIAQDGWTVAFNLADLGVVAGFLLTTIGVLALVIGRRDELRTAVER
jgi:hypothetical protein